MERHASSGTTYPTMALELARVISVCEALSDGKIIDIEPKISRSRCEEVVISALTTRSVGSHQSVSVDALSGLILTHVEDVLRNEEEASEDRVEELREIVKLVHAGVAVEELNGVWNDKQHTGSVDETVELFSSHGWDALNLSWAVILFETHKHINLIWHQANKLEKSFPDRQASDLFGWGWVGLRIALRHYNPELGFAFSTYACTRIIGSIRDGVRSESPVPKRLATYARKVAQAEATLTQSLGRKPSLEEVASHLIDTGNEVASLALMPRLTPAASVDEIVSNAAEHGGIPNWLINSEDPADCVLDSVRAEAISKALETLPSEDREAVKLLVMDALSPTEARTVTGATARQMRQRRERGLAALRSSLEPWAEKI